MRNRHSTIQAWIACALLLFGALVACTSSPTTELIATATLIPSTATQTASPVTVSPTIAASATATALATATHENFVAIIESEVTPDAPLMRQIFDDLAAELGISTDRIQLVSVEEGAWSRRTLACDTASVAPVSVIANDPDREVAGFRFLLLVGDTIYEYHTQGTQRYVRCPGVERASGELLLAIDPAAADMFGLVQRRVANELDLSTRRVQLVDIRSVTWSDTSLGCPQAGQNYETAEIDGYRIVVSAGGNEYIFHSDSTRVYPCSAEQEFLPEENQ